jgi:hypothetical protein
MPEAMRWLTAETAAFGAVFAVATALSIAAGLFVTASFFVADRGVAEDYLGFHLAVSGAFVALGLLLASIAVQALGLAKYAADFGSGATAPLRMRVSRLLLRLAVAGLGLCVVLAVILWGILSRIGEGFAVFG